MTPDPEASEVLLPLVLLLAACVPILLAWRSPELELAWATLSSFCG
ncbi:hypothetical protein SAMN05216328_12858 [Ensifer sp. YR511]|nr:hypothetical protein SAMN05216328_12858 [Ensifer sp. YR511]